MTQSCTNNDLNLVIDNKSGVIKADNNITIHAKTLNNTAYHYDTKQDDSDGYYGYDVNEKVVKSDYVMDQTLVLEQDEQVSTLASNPAFISALKDININLSDELFNSSSVISAKQDLSITANKSPMKQTQWLLIKCIVNGVRSGWIHGGLQKLVLLSGVVRLVMQTEQNLGLILEAN
ncbi:hypothetical protein BSPWISOXPB_10613 [uncultured Gammaproteobacteria bacterium]|nr:hypothetical protein BSPWISOXPB_10613 [uncultured Gammaproteobacteria bacterium]